MSGKMMDGNRASREEADAVIEILREALFFNLCEKFEVCGSYRRNKNDIGDLDIVFIPRNIGEFEAWFSKLPYEKKQSPRGYFLSINGIQVDFFPANEDTYGVQVLNFTGPAGFSIFLSGWAAIYGLKYTKYKILNNEGKNIAAGKTEEEVFEILNLDWVPPENRETMC